MKLPVDVYPYYFSLLLFEKLCNCMSFQNFMRLIIDHHPSYYRMLLSQHLCYISYLQYIWTRPHGAAVFRGTVSTNISISYGDRRGMSVILQLSMHRGGGRRIDEAAARISRSLVQVQPRHRVIWSSTSTPCARFLLSPTYYCSIRTKPSLSSTTHGKTPITLIWFLEQTISL